MRTLLESSYAYLSWTTNNPTRDTLHIAWIRDVDTTYYSSRVDFRVRSPDAVIRVDSFPVAFEDWPVVIQRNGAVDGWHPDSVRRAWLAVLDTVILMPNVRTGVFTRIPLSAVVVFEPTRTAKVNVTASELGIDTLAGPTFRVRAVVNDPRRGTIESADLRLEDCHRAGDRRAYTCTVNELQYPPPSRPVTESNLESLLRVATITKARPYIDHYKPARNRRPKSEPLGPSKSEP